MLTLLALLGAVQLPTQADVDRYDPCADEDERSALNDVLLVGCRQEDIITVTGRAPVPLADSPASVDVVTAEEVREQALLTLTDALLLVPGVQVVSTGPVGTQASVFVRGTDSDHVLATYDGIRLNNPATPDGLYSFGSDLVGGAARIEVLRGPASATYGSDAIGGVVNTVPRTGEEPGGAATLSVGELETYTASADHAGRVARLTYAVGARALATEGFDALPGRIVPEPRAGERDGAEAYELSANAAYALSGPWTLEGTFLRREAEAEFDTFSGGPSGFQRADDPDLRSEDGLTVARAGLAFEEGPWTAHLRGGIVKSRFEERDGDAVTGDVRGERVFGEALAQRRGEGWLLSAGLVAEEESADVPVSFADPLSASETHLGAFLFGQREAGPLVLSGAVRLDDYEAFGTPATVNAGAVWRPLEGLRLHASYGTAYNAPSLAERFSTGAFAVPNPDLQEERAESGEVGVAYEARAFGGTVTPSLVLFRTDTEDLIEFDFGSFENRNVGDARAQGIEAAVAAALPSFSARIAYTYTDAQNEETGVPLLRRPEHAVTAVFDWQATDRLALSGRYVHTGERPDVTYTDGGFFGGTAEVEGYGEAALTARYAATEAVMGFVTVTNLTAETFEQPAAFGSPPRMVRVGVTVGW
jgi:vitamin B12 transporter